MFKLNNASKYVDEKQNYESMIFEYFKYAHSYRMNMSNIHICVFLFPFPVDLPYLKNPLIYLHVVGQPDV